MSFGNRFILFGSDPLSTRENVGEFQFRSGSPVILALVGLCMGVTLLACEPIQAGMARLQQPQSTSAASVNTVVPDEIRISGSNLITPRSLGFDIPTAVPQPTDLDAVETRDEYGNSVIARVHVKVGENFIVLLPNGQLVARAADQVTRSERDFKAARQKDVADEILANQLARFSNMKFEKGGGTFIYLYNTTTEFKDATRGILQSMLRGVKGFAGNMGLETHNPDVPLVVIMFATEREFQAYKPVPRGVVAYYDMISNHIVLHQESPLADVRPDLAKGQLLSTIAHEGAHQILHNIGVQQRLTNWPMWLSEGMAEYFAPTSFGKRNRWKGAGEVNDLRMFELETFLQTQYIEGFDGRTMSKAVTEYRLDSTGYATAWGIVHFLANRKRKQFNKYVQQLSQMTPLYGMLPRNEQPIVENLEHFHEFFGEDMEKSEKDMMEYLTRLDYESPVYDFFHYVGMAIVPDSDGSGSKRFACFFHTEDKVEQWKAVLGGTLSEQQRRGSEWEMKKVKDRRAASNLIQSFLK